MKRMAVQTQNKTTIIRLLLERGKPLNSNKSHFFNFLYVLTLKLRSLLESTPPILYQVFKTIIFSGECNH